MKRFLVAASIALLSAAPAAFASDVTFTLTPTNGAAFTLTVNPTDFVGGPTETEDYPIPGTYDGGILAVDPAYYGSLDLDITPNFSIYGNNDFSGPILFSYAPGATYPTFFDGTYSLTYDYGDAGYGDATLVIAGGATPEPSSLILLGTGALSLAAAARRRFPKA